MFGSARGLVVSAATGPNDAGQCLGLTIVPSGATMAKSSWADGWTQELRDSCETACRDGLTLRHIPQPASASDSVPRGLSAACAMPISSCRRLLRPQGNKALKEIGG